MRNKTLACCACGALLVVVACGGKTETGEPLAGTSGKAGSSGAAGVGGKAGAGQGGNAGAGQGGSPGVGGQPGVGGSSGYSLPASCGGVGLSFSCVPTTDQGCAGGSQCDYSASKSPDFACRPEGPPGQGCNPATNLNCPVGETCMGEDAVGGIHPAGGAGVYLLTCRQFCCSDSDCDFPDWCTNASSVGHFAFESTNIGVCWHWGGVNDAGMQD